MLEMFFFGFHNPEVEGMLGLIIILLVLDVVVIAHPLMLSELNLKRIGR
jgi:hypothetical protein